MVNQQSVWKREASPVPTGQASRSILRQHVCNYTSLWILEEVHLITGGIDVFTGSFFLHETIS